MAVTAGEMLTEAANIVEGSRQATHGDKERSFEWIASQWELTLAMRPGGRSAPISGATVAVMMADLKKVRLFQGEPIKDHFVDFAGYVGIAGEIMLSEIENRPNQEELPKDSGGHGQALAAEAPKKHVDITFDADISTVSFVGDHMPKIVPYAKPAETAEAVAIDTNKTWPHSINGHLRGGPSGE